MLDFPTTFLAWLVATTVPAFLGLHAIVSAGKVLKARYLAAFAVGIYFWFFNDTLGGAATLQVNSGFGGGYGQIAIILLFGIGGVLFFFWLDRNRHIFAPEMSMGKFGVAIPVLVAVAVGIHGWGEGAAAGGTAALTSTTNLLDAFGGVSAVIAYFLHKGLEPMMIGACYLVYSKDHAKSITSRLKDIALLTVLFVIPSLIGAATGYYLTYDSSYFYGLGVGTSLYAAMRLSGPLFVGTNSVDSRDAIRIAVMIILGFLSLYFAALFHSG
jgi:hypothetical protein